MKFSKYLPMMAAALSIAASYPAEISADTSALPSPAQVVQNSSVSAPLDTASSLFLKVVVAKVSGDVSVQRKGKTDFEVLSKKTELAQGDVVKTGEGACHLVVGGKSKLFIEPNTTLSVTEALKNGTGRSESTKLSLQGGRLKIELPNLKNGSTFEVTTPTAVATVRGTVFYLFVGEVQQKLMSELYVDKSDGGVLFKNLFTGSSILVPRYSVSQSFQDGTLEPSKELTPEEQKEFIRKWGSLGGASQQFGVEEVPLNNSAAPPSSNIPEGFADAFERFGLNDAFVDRLVEQNVVGQNLDAPAAPSTPDENVITDADKAVIFGVLDDTLTDQEFDQIDAGQAQTEDAQTAKVFTDVHGNRVRVDQYITQPSPSSVSFLSLTLREGPYQTGVTSLLFATQFNDVLTGNFRDLPWNDYMNVVTDQELTGLSTGQQYEQFIVHEHEANLGAGPSLYPILMVALFGTPLQADQTDLGNYGFVFFGEMYSSPFRVTSDQGDFWVQGLQEDLVTIAHGSGEIASSNSFADQPRETFVNDNLFASFQDSGSPQTSGLASSAGLANLDTPEGINFFRNNPIHPSYIENQFGADRALIGLFLPIDDNGQVFDAPGFHLYGLRDLVRPNTLVNGGNYNLEVIFLYGSLNDDVFSEIFRIDALITPEIFFGSPESGPGFGLKGLDGALVTDTVFPSTLDTADEQSV